MSEFDDMMSGGFSEVIGQVGVSITHGSVARKCVTTRFSQVKILNDSGMMIEAPGDVELTNADFLALKIADRSVISIGGMDAYKFKVMKIDMDPSDPCVLLTLKIEQKPVGTR